MIELTHNEVMQINGAFKFHFNLAGVAASIIAGVCTGNPAGVVGAIGAALILQGGGNLKDMLDANGFQYQYVGNQPFAYIHYDYMW